VFNLAGWARPPSQWLMLGAGVVLGAPALRSLRRPAQLGLHTVLAVGVLLGVGLMVCATVLPAATFNYHDDFQKYFVHPIRMLQTGSVYGSSVSAIGFETLGGQAWLHTFVLSFAQVDMLNAVDFGLGFLLCLALAGFGPDPGRFSAPARGAAIAALLVINPQVVNISSLYTGAALCLSIWLINLDAALDAKCPRPAHAALTGLMLAALLALKTSYLVFAAFAAGALTLAVAAAAYLSNEPVARRALRYAAVCCAATVLCVAPWLLVHAPNYAAALLRPALGSASLPTNEYSVEPFSFRVYGYGDGFAPYTWVVLACACLGGLCFLAWLRSGKPRELGLTATLCLALGTAIGALYVCMLYVVGPRSQGELTTLRLYVPMLLGSLPALFIAGARCLNGAGRWQLLQVACLALLPLGAFTPYACHRLWQAIARGSVVAFDDLDAKPWYIGYNREVLHGSMRERVARAQAAIPAGAPFVTWINAPFWLDFRRNQIADLELAGLATPWSSIPAVPYVMWEYNSRPTMQITDYQRELNEAGHLQVAIADAGLRLVYAMLSLPSAAQVVFNDQQIMVLKLADPSALRAALHAAKPPAPPAARRFDRSVRALP
jgi:hypothetical protein